MNKLIKNGLIFILIFIAGIFIGYKIKEFFYLDKCLDMGGGMNPGDYDICVIEKEKDGDKGVILEKKEVKNIDRKDKKEVVVNAKLPDFYKGLDILKKEIFQVEVSREKKDCVGIVPQKCLQVRKEGGEWELYYDDIVGFDYEEGNYYVLEVEEYIFKVDNNFPADAPNRIWKLVSIEKNILPQR